ncbi:hypothetical protein B0A48_14112 [Cryoendolithus antarcticus]|uniref:F-box domain-containing protein n=1 Tax=Cryoendolithus antarcticus TaxID=1507870 RepID=A0A1V8SLK3_9PEZI|nr:hypothetical protein B0A48_14112 [Cryoendolithus antarcticus]
MPFEQLPPEIRVKIYDHVFSGSSTNITISKDNISTQRLSSLYQGTICRGDAALLLVNRLVYSEAKALLCDNREFAFASMQDFNRWIPQIAGNVQFIQHLTIGRSTPGLLKQCYGLLRRATSLKSFQVTFSYTIKGTLKKHLDEHWEVAKPYFVGDGVSREEGKRRVDLVTFAVSPSQKGVLEDDGSVLKELTADHQAICHKWFKLWVERYRNE